MTRRPNKSIYPKQKCWLEFKDGSKMVQNIEDHVNCFDLVTARNGDKLRIAVMQRQSNQSDVFREIRSFLASAY